MSPDVKQSMLEVLDAAYGRHLSSEEILEILEKHYWNGWAEGVEEGMRRALRVVNS